MHTTQINTIVTLVSPHGHFNVIIVWTYLYLVCASSDIHETILSGVVGSSDQVTINIHLSIGHAHTLDGRGSGLVSSTLLASLKKFVYLTCFTIRT